MGHSYGSFLSQAFAQQGTDVKAIALVGSGHMRTLFTLGKIAVAPIFLVARNWRPRIVNWVSDNMQHYKGDSGKLQWANSVKERREQVMADRLAHQNMSVGFDYYMMKETSKLYGKKRARNSIPQPSSVFSRVTQTPWAIWAKASRNSTSFIEPTVSRRNCTFIKAQDTRCFTIGAVRKCKRRCGFL